MQDAELFPVSDCMQLAVDAAWKAFTEGSAGEMVKDTPATLAARLQNAILSRWNAEDDTIRGNNAGERAGKITKEFICIYDSWLTKLSGAVLGENATAKSLKSIQHLIPRKDGHLKHDHIFKHGPALHYRLPRAFFGPPPVDVYADEQIKANLVNHAPVATIG
jgi:hypothetical protein